MMVKAHPEALTLSDIESMECIAIHLLLTNKHVNSLHDIVKFMVEAIPSSLHAVDLLGRVPLHLACEHNNIDSKTVELLLSSWPESISRADRRPMRK